MSFLQSFQTHPQMYAPAYAQAPQQPQPQPMQHLQPQFQYQPSPQLQPYQPNPQLWQPVPPPQSQTASQGPTTHPSRANWGGRGPMLRPRGSTGAGLGRGSRGGGGAGRGGRGGGGGYSSPAVEPLQPIPMPMQAPGPVYQQQPMIQQSQQPIYQQPPQQQQPIYQQQPQPQPIVQQMMCQPQPQPVPPQILPQPQLSSFRQSHIGAYQQPQVPVQQPQQAWQQPAPTQFSSFPQVQPQQQPLQAMRYAQPQPAVRIRDAPVQVTQVVPALVQQQQQVKAELVSVRPTTTAFVPPVAGQTLQQQQIQHQFQPQQGQMQQQQQQQQQQQSYQQPIQAQQQQPHQPLQAPQHDPLHPQPLQQQPRYQVVPVQRAASQVPLQTPAYQPPAQPQQAAETVSAHVAPFWPTRQPSGSPEPIAPSLDVASQLQPKPTTKISLPGLDLARQRLSTDLPKAPQEADPELEPESLNIDWLNPDAEEDPLISAPTLIEHPARVWNSLLHGLEREMQPTVRWTFELGEGADPLTTAHLTLVLPPTHPALKSHADFATLPISRYDLGYESSVARLAGVKNWAGQPRRLKLDAQNTTITLAISQNALGWVENPFNKNPDVGNAPPRPLNVEQTSHPQPVPSADGSMSTSSTASSATGSEIEQEAATMGSANHGPMTQAPAVSAAPALVQQQTANPAELKPGPASASTATNGMVKLEWGGGLANGGGETWVPAALLSSLQSQASGGSHPSTPQPASTSMPSPGAPSAAEDGPNATACYGESSAAPVHAPSASQPGPCLRRSAPAAYALPTVEAAPLSPVSAAVRMMAERTNVDLIDNTCVSLGRGGIDVNWKETQNEATQLYGCELNINICPSVTRYFSTPQKHVTPELAKEDCASIAIRKEAIDFVSKYAKYAVPKAKEVQSAAKTPESPKTPPLIFSGGRFSLPVKTDPLAPVQTLVPVEPVAPPTAHASMDLLLEALRESVDPSQQADVLRFEPFVDEDTDKHGCVLIATVRGQIQSYLEESTWASMELAREAVCAQALKLNVQGWMSWAEETFKPVDPSPQPPQLAPGSISPDSAPTDACTTIYHALARQALKPEVRYEREQTSKLYKAELIVPNPSQSNSLVFSVPSMYTHKADAREAVAQQALQQGVLAVIGQRAPSPAPAMTQSASLPLPMILQPGLTFGPQQQQATGSDTVASSASSPVQVTELTFVHHSPPSRSKRRKTGKSKRGKNGRAASGFCNPPSDDGWSGQKRKASDAEWVNKLMAICMQRELPDPTFEYKQAEGTDELDEPLYRVAVTVGLQQFYAPTSEPLADLEEAKEFICRKACEHLSPSKRPRQ